MSVFNVSWRTREKIEALPTRSETVRVICGGDQAFAEAPVELSRA